MKKQIKSIVELEDRTGKEFKNTVELLSGRVMCRKMKDMGFTVNVMNKANLNTDDIPLERIEAVLENFERNLKVSRWKQKCFTYIYNGDKENAIKYHKKMAEFRCDQIENMRENPEEYYIRVDNSLNNQEEENFEGKLQGFRRFCEEVQKNFDMRKTYIDRM